MRRFVTSLFMALALVLGLATVATPAAAVGTCPGSAGAVGKPAALVGGKWALWNTKSSGYTGTPFSFKVKLQYSSWPNPTLYKWYTYDNRGVGYRHSMTTGAIRPGVVKLVQGWCNGRRAADWVGSVRSR